MLADDLFPLTPALSLGEREQLSPVFRDLGARSAMTALGLRERRDAILPLPEGEGWGEGERVALIFQRGPDSSLVVRCFICLFARAQGFAGICFLNHSAARSA